MTTDPFGEIIEYNAPLYTYLLLAESRIHMSFLAQKRNGILLPKLFGPTVRKNCSRDREKLLKFEAEGREFAKFLRSLE